jgi:hypothetical protein
MNQYRYFQDFAIVHELLHLHVPIPRKILKVVMSAHVPGRQEFEVKW